MGVGCQFDCFSEEKHIENLGARWAATRYDAPHHSVSEIANGPKIRWKPLSRSPKRTKRRTNTMNEPDFNKYERAQKRVSDIKGFHRHVITYVVINIIIVLAHIGIFDAFAMKNTLDEDVITWNLFITPVLWGIGLGIHALRVFVFKGSFFKRWEERKIQELMDEEENM